MTFENTNNRAIYLQIADRICDMILDGTYPENQRLPPVREIAASVEVTTNTVLRAFERLTKEEIIYSQRGVGLFVSPGARERIISRRRDELMTTGLKSMFRTLRLLGITPEELSEAYLDFLRQHILSR